MLEKLQKAHKNDGFSWPSLLVNYQKTRPSCLFSMAAVGAGVGFGVGSRGVFSCAIWLYIFDSKLVNR